MKPDTEAGEDIDGGPHVERAAAQPVELCDNEHIPIFEAIEEAAELRPLASRDASRDCFHDDPVGADGEAGGLRLGDLILGGLLDRRDAGIQKYTGHGAIPSKNLPELSGGAHNLVKHSFGHIPGWMSETDWFWAVQD